MITEQDKLDTLGLVSEAINLYQVFDALKESINDVQFTIECSVGDAYWRVIIIRPGKEDVEGCGWSVTAALINTLPYLND